MRSFLFLSTLILLTLSEQGFADQTGIERYAFSKKIFWNELYDSPGESLYCKQKFERRSGLNIEHVFAAAWMKNQGGCSKMNRKECRRRSPRFNLMEADLHNLYPSKVRLNSKRSNFPFTIIEGEQHSECDLEIFDREVEPAPHARGKIARAVLYMEYEYGADIDKDTDSVGQRELLLSWHCQYPVQEDDIKRNLKIINIQGNSNPYIDGSIKIDCDNVFDYSKD